MKKIILSLLWLIAWDMGWAQDPQMSQPLSQPMYLNPAYAGTTRAHRVALTHRTQYLRGASGSYSTSWASYDLFFINRMGFGVTLKSDQQSLGANPIVNGDLISQKINFLGGYEWNLSRNLRARGGLEVGFGQRRVNEGGLQFGNGLTPTGSTGNGFDPLAGSLQTKVYPDISAGVMLGGDRATIGVAVHHLNRPTGYSLFGDRDGALQRKITVHGTYDGYLLFDPGKFRIYGEYRAQGAFDQMALGLQKFFLIHQNPSNPNENNSQAFLGIMGRGLVFKQEGESFNNTDALIVTAGFASNSKWAHTQFGVSYDVTTSQLNFGNTLGTIEISVMHQFKNKGKGMKNLGKIAYPVRGFSSNEQCEDYLLWSNRKNNGMMLVPVKNAKPGKKLGKSRKETKKKRWWFFFN